MIHIASLLHDDVIDVSRHGGHQISARSAEPPDDWWSSSVADTDADGLDPPLSLSLLAPLPVRSHSTA
jgi:hypothetical protein